MKVNVVFQDTDDREVYYMVRLELDQLCDNSNLQRLYNEARENDDFEFYTWLDDLIKTKQIKGYEPLGDFTWRINY